MPSVFQWLMNGLHWHGQFLCLLILWLHTVCRYPRMLHANPVIPDGLPEVHFHILWPLSLFANWLHFYSGFLFLQTSLICLIFTNSHTQPHTNGRGCHARRQPAQCLAQSNSGTVSSSMSRTIVRRSRMHNSIPSVTEQLLYLLPSQPPPFANT